MPRFMAFVAALLVGYWQCGFVVAQAPADPQTAAPAVAPPASRAAWEALLREPVTLQFEDLSLPEVLEGIAAKHKLDLQIDTGEIPEPESILVNLLVPKPIPLSSALSILLEPHDLAYLVRDDGILITSSDRVAESFFTRIYKVGDLLAAADGPRTIDELIQAITTTITRSSWPDEGGQATITSLGDLLLVTQNRWGHEDIASLLAALRRDAQPADRPHDKAEAAQPTVQEILTKPTLFMLTDVSLVEAVELLTKKYDLVIQLDTRALSEQGIEPASAPVTLSIKKPTPLRSALDRMLEPLQLGWAIRHDALYITSDTCVEETVSVRTYPAADLLTPREGRSWTADDLLAAITTSVFPHSWSEAGATGAIARFGSTLVVAQNRAGHEELARLLAQIRADLPEEAAAGDSRAGPAEARPSEELTIVPYSIRLIAAADVVRALPELIAPQSWQANGCAGAACVMTAEQPSGGKSGDARAQTVVVVRQRPAIHRKIRRLIRKLDQPSVEGMGGMGVAHGGFF